MLQLADCGNECLGVVLATLPAHAQATSACVCKTWWLLLSEMHLSPSSSFLLSTVVPLVISALALVVRQ